MKKATILSIFMLVVLLVLSLPLVDSVSAAVRVTATPNPGKMWQVITITITAEGEEVTKWKRCELLVSFGDGTPNQRIGKLIQQTPQVSKKSINHRYSKADIYTIEVVPQSCILSTSNVLKTTVKILPVKPRLDRQRGR